ncbi:glycosyltransferase family 2 protein [Sphingomonas sp. MMS24-J13]|uniref:glycosyltransferase family 2 protein n=1 Tax=Sphingomonas sp. MMS24-J13 TaxID=3238686 RepID=UPI00384EA0B8
MKPVSVLVVIVNYRTPVMAVDAAGALAAEVMARGDVHVAIVDNQSGDGSAETIAAAIAARGYDSWCSLISEDRNGGFAAGNNAGLRWYHERTGGYPEYAWLLNPDTIAEAGALGALVDFLEINPTVGIVGSRCLERDGTVWPSAFRFMDVRSELDGAINFGPVTRLLGNPVIAPRPTDEPMQAQWVSGTSMMVRRLVIERIGLMDEGYFLYFEETDYCARARDAGFDIWTVPASRVVHIGGQATGVTGEARAVKRRPRYWFASRARFFLHAHGLACTHLANLMWLLGYPLGRLIAWARGRTRDDPPRLWLDFLHAYYGHGGIMYRPTDRARTMGVGNG